MIITFESIEKAACSYYKYEKEEVYVKTHKRKIVQVRQIITYLARIKAKMSISQVSKMIEKSNGTVVYSIKVIKNLYEVDKTIKNDIDTIIDNIHNDDRNRKKEAIINDLKELMYKVNTGNISHTKLALTQIIENIRILL